MSLRCWLPALALPLRLILPLAAIVTLLLVVAVRRPDSAGDMLLAEGPFPSNLTTARGDTKIPLDFTRLTLSNTSPEVLLQGDIEYRKPAKSRGLVVPRLQADDVAWIGEQLGGIDITVYLANEKSSELRPPMNKGHEAMIYLTYIIDHYMELPEIVIFMHAHRHSHHNNDLLQSDAVSMIKRLQSHHVLRQGYFNMRCRWHPGCPNWLSTNLRGDAIRQQEQLVLTESWLELYPRDVAPVTLAQPCCAQFATSRRQILSLPLSRYIHLRDWLIKTPLSDFFSGRIYEYTWQYLLTGKGTYCPTEIDCYCMGYGICAS